MEPRLYPAVAVIMLAVYIFVGVIPGRILEWRSSGPSFQTATRCAEPASEPGRRAHGYGTVPRGTTHRTGWPVTFAISS
jgi:hypothetical protein